MPQLLIAMIIGAGAILGSLYYAGRGAEHPVPTADEVSLENTEEPREFYINTNGSRVRSCAALTCDVVLRLDVGTVIVPAKYGGTIDELPEWLPIEVNGMSGFYSKQILSATPPEPAVANAIPSSSTATLPATPGAAAQLKSAAIAKKSAVIDTLLKEKETRQAQDELFRIEMQYRENVVEILKPYPSRPLLDYLRKVTGEQNALFENSRDTIASQIDVVDKVILSYSEKDATVFLSADYQVSVTAHLLKAQQAFDDAEAILKNLRGKYDDLLEEVKDSLGTSVSTDVDASPSPTSATYSGTNTQPSSSNPCSSNQGVSICGSTNFDPTAYSIESMVNSYGETMYKVNPPSGAKIPALGYFPSEQAAIDSYEAYLINNNLPR